MKSRPNLTNFVYLVGSGLIIQLLGTIYRIWLARRIGPEGLGIFQMIYPVYRLLSGIAALGLPAVLTKWIAEYLTLKDYDGIITLRDWSLRTVTLMAAGFGVLLYFAAPWLGHSVYLDPRVTLAIQCVAPAIPFSALSAIYRGYFQGFSRMAPTAVSEVSEQILEVATAFCCIEYFTFLRMAPYACPVLGLTMGEIACLATLIFYARSLRSNAFPTLPSSGTTSPETASSIPRAAIFHYTWPLLINQIVVAVSIASEGILIPRLLFQAGIPIAAGTGLFGELSGMAAPIAYFPLFFVAPLATVLSPQVSAAVKAGEPKRIGKKIRFFYYLSGLITLAGGIMILFLAEPISRILYGTDSPAGLMRLLFCGLPFTAITFLNITILGATGDTGGILRLSLWAVGLKTCTLVFFTPLLGIRGAAWAFNITQIFTALASSVEARKVWGKSIKSAKNMFRLCSATKCKI